MDRLWRALEYRGRLAPWRTLIDAAFEFLCPDVDPAALSDPDLFG